MTIPEIGLVSTFAAMLALLITVGVMRMLPARPQPVATSDQARYLMDQVLVERETARVLRVELDVTKAKVVALEIQVVERDKRISSLESQVSDLWSMVRGQAVAQASAHDATRPIQNGNRTKTATAAFSDDDVAFRDWIIATLTAKSWPCSPLTPAWRNLSSARLHRWRRRWFRRRGGLGMPKHCNTRRLKCIPMWRRGD